MRFASFFSCGVVPLAAALVAWGLADAAQAQSAVDVPTRTIARVIASGGVGGRFGRPICQHGVDLESAPSALYTYALAREARSVDRPMVIDTGGLLTPHGIARFAAREDPEALAELVGRLGYRALAFGENELSAPRESLIDVLRALREQGVPSIATNLRCSAPGAPLCEVLVDGQDGISLHESGGRLTAVLAFLEPEAIHRIAPNLSEGLSIEDPAVAMPREVRRARSRGAEVVLVIAALSSADALALAQGLPEDGRPDLMLLAGTGDLLFARPATVVPPIVSPPVGDAVEVLVREGILRAGYEMVAQPLEGRGIDVAVPVRDFLAEVGPSYCAEWGRTLAGGRLTRELDADELARLAGRVIADHAGADVAVLNLGAIDVAWRPSRDDSLTASDLYVALEYDEPLVYADVPPPWIDALLARAEEHGLVTPGASRDGDSSRVLGRALEPRATYRVVTLRFLASGGDDALPPLPSGYRWQPLEGATLRSVVLERLGRPSDRDPRDAISDRAQMPEWILRADLDAQFAGSSIHNPSTYDAALLNRTSTIALGLALNLRADARAPDWSWENLGAIAYRTQWAPSATAGSAGTFTEAVDQIQVRTLGAYRGFRQSPGEWWVPDPYLEVFIESELTTADPMVRSFHWLFFRPTIGVRFPLSTELEVRLSTGLQTQVLDPASEAEFGLGATLTLRPWDLARIEDRHITVDSTIDWFMVDPGDQNRWQLRSSFNGAFDLAGPLALTIGFRLYLQQDRGQDVAVALDATAGVQVGALGRLVGP